MKFERESNQMGDIIDASTGLEELLACFVPDSQIERELNGSNSPAHHIPDDVAQLSSRLTSLTRSSSPSIRYPLIYMNSTEIDDRKLKDSHLEQQVVPSASPDCSIVRQDPVISQTSVYSPRILQYPMLPQLSTKSYFGKTDDLFASKTPNLEDCLISAEAHGPVATHPHDPSIVRIALDHDETYAFKHNENNRWSNRHARRVQTVTYGNSPRTGCLRSQASTKDKNLSDKDDRTELHAEDYSVSFPKDTSFQYILTQMKTIDELETIPEDRQIEPPIRAMKIRQFMENCSEKLEDKVPQPVCKESYIESWLAEVYGEEVGINVYNPAYHPDASEYLVMIADIALDKPLPCS
ncbi:hypothetical protein MMC26_000492 [Xylographa opegraphella]|nr:hypothetical protein [Xylographa opegraphella]